MLTTAGAALLTNGAKESSISARDPGAAFWALAGNDGQVVEAEGTAGWMFADREKTLAFHFLYRQGVTLLRSIEASARTGMKTLMWQEVSLGNLMQETAKDNDVAYVFLTDGHGTIAHHSDPSKESFSASWLPADIG